MNCRVILSVVLAMALSGCAGWNRGAPTCDGSAKRPLNRSLWEWEVSPPAAPKTDAPPVKRLGKLLPASSAGGGDQPRTAWSSFDIVRSFLPCGEATSHG